MLGVAAADEFVGPEEEHSGQEAGVLLETGLVGKVSVELILGLVWLGHQDLSDQLLKIYANIFICSFKHLRLSNSGSVPF